MTGELIPKTPVRGGRVFQRLEWEDLGDLSDVHESYAASEAIAGAIDTKWVNSVEVALATEGVDLFGFEALVPGNTEGSPFDEPLDTIGLSVIWMPTTSDEPIEHPSVYAFARQGRDGLTGLDPLPVGGSVSSMGGGGSDMTGSLFVAHSGASPLTADDWCRQFAHSSVATSAPVLGELATYTASGPAFLTRLSDVWYHYAGRLAIQTGTDVTARYGDVRYRHFEELLDALGLRGDSRVELIPPHEYYGARTRATPRWSTGIQLASAASGSFTVPKKSSNLYEVASRRAERAVAYKEVNLRTEAKPDSKIVKPLDTGTKLYVIDSKRPGDYTKSFWHQVTTADLKSTGWVVSSHVKVGLPDEASAIHRINPNETARDLVTNRYSMCTWDDSENRRGFFGLLKANRGPGDRGIYLPSGAPEGTVLVRPEILVWLPSCEWIDNNVPRSPPEWPEFDNLREPDWSGTDIPPPHRREELRDEARKARENNGKRDEALRGNLNKQFDRVIIGSGFGAVLHLATSTPGIRKKAAKSPPAVIAIEQGEMWDTFRPIEMGQSPALLSPQGLIEPPLHFMTDPKRETRFLPLTAFANAIAWNHDRLRLSALHGTVTDISRKPEGSEPEDSDLIWPDFADEDAYRITVNMMQSPTEPDSTTGQQVVSLYAKTVDILSGLGPSRALSDKQITPEHRATLRQEVSRQNHQWRRLLTGEEVLRGDRNIPPVGKKKKMRVLIYGGSPTGSWAWERYHESDDDRPYEIYWVGYLDEEKAGDDREANLKRAFKEVMVGERNTVTLEQSKEFRYVGELTNVEPSTEDGQPVVSVSFKSHDRLESPPISTFDQIVVAIGRDPLEAHGVVDVLLGTREKRKALSLSPIIENETTISIPEDPLDYRPIGVQSEDGRLRALGAAGVALANYERKQIVSIPEVDINENEFYNFGRSMKRLLESLPPEAHVPPGITVAGITLPLADNRRPVLDQKTNINTANKIELQIGLAIALDRDNPKTQDGPKMTDDAVETAGKIADAILGHRTDAENVRGFDEVETLRSVLTGLGFEDEYDTLKWDVRV